MSPRAATLLLTLIATGCRAPETPPEPIPFYASAELTPQWLAASAARDVPRVAAFQLSDHTGASFTEAELDGRVTVVAFFFTSCPSVCPPLIRNLKQVQDAAAATPGGTIRLVGFSVDPGRDDVPALAAFADARGIQAPAWRLVTGEKRTLYTMARTSFFADGSGRPIAEDDFLHTELVFLLDGERRIRGVYDGLLAYDMGRVIEDARTLASGSGAQTARFDR